MNWYTIQFKNGTFTDGYAKWDGVNAEDLLVALGLTASDARTAEIRRILPDRRPYVTYVDFRASERERAA